MNTIPALNWRKSSFSFSNSNCVEVTADAGCVLVRNSRQPSGLKLVFTPDEFSAFLAGAKAGDFDHIAPADWPDRGAAELAL